MSRAVWVLVLGTPLLAAQGTGKARAAVLLKTLASGGTIQVDFVQAPGGAPLRSPGLGMATLDLGTISALGGTAGAGVSLTLSGGVLYVQTDFAILIRQTGGGSATSATLSAFLSRRGGGGTSLTVSVDGVRLTSSPQVIRTMTPFGTPTAHNLTIEVPTTAPGGPLDFAVGVMAVAN